MLTTGEALLLGVIQGITEWFPVSSSAHLMITERLLGLSPSVFFNISLHIATLLVIVFVFRKDIVSMIKCIYKRDFSSPHGRHVLFLVAGTVPTAIVGYLVEAFAFTMLSGNLFMGIALVITGMFVFLSKFGSDNSGLDSRRSIIIGALQGISALPGISRSGLTIGYALFSGIKHEEAVRYSFLLSIPAVAGAMLFEVLRGGISGSNIHSVALGMMAAVVVGYPFLKALIKIVSQKRFYLFSFYCWTLGTVFVLLSFLGI